MESFAEKFRARASVLGYPEDLIVKCIDYADKLRASNLPIIYSNRHLSLLLGVKIQYLQGVTHKGEKYYRYYKIRNGRKTREINEPLPTLKMIQYWILKEILEKNTISRFSKAYTKGSTIKSNAYYHRGKKVVINLDVKNFFTSIKQSSITDIFVGMGYWRGVAELLSRLCTYDNSLPQGAPTSPYLSNLYMSSFDNSIGPWIVNNGHRYTRYSDDITISGDISNSHELIERVSLELGKKGLLINSDKTIVQNRGMRQMVTGLVVNDRIQVPRTYRRNVRLEMFYIKKYGLEAHLNRRVELKPYSLDSLFGRIDFVLQMTPNNEEFLSYKAELLKLSGIE